jgi:hypothetical protein
MIKWLVLVSMGAALGYGVVIYWYTLCIDDWRGYQTEGLEIDKDNPLKYYG